MGTKLQERDKTVLDKSWIVSPRHGKHTWVSGCAYSKINTCYRGQPIWQYQTPKGPNLPKRHYSANPLELAVRVTR